MQAIGFVLSFVLLLVSGCAAQDPAGARPAIETYAASVRVTGRVLNNVRPALFGDNIEWVHNGMGVWLPDRRAFDAQIVAELRAVGITHLRYPGGTLSDYFHWEEAVGDARRPQVNPFEKGARRHPAFGPGEFMALCRTLGIGATLTLNAGTGTQEEAVRWAQYCRERGFPVDRYEVGNEIYMADPKNEQVPGMPVAKTPRQYADFFLQCRDGLDRAGLKVKLGAIGLLDTGAFPLNRYPDWLPEVLRAAGDRMDFLALHNGYAPAMRASGFGPIARRHSDDDFARCLLGASVYVRDNLEATKVLLRRHAPGGGSNIELHITEHGPLVYPIDPAHAADDAAWNRSLAGALYLACLYNVFLREPKVAGANHLPLCQDIFGALIGIRGVYPQRKLWRNAVFHVFRQYSGLAGRTVLAVDVAAPVYSVPSIGIVPALKDVPLLDAAAYRARDGRGLRLFLINRDIARAARVKIAPGAGRYRMSSAAAFTAGSYKAENTPEKPDVVAPAPLPAAPPDASGAFTVEVPRHALVVVDLVREKGSRKPEVGIRKKSSGVSLPTTDARIPTSV